MKVIAVVTDSTQILKILRDLLNLAIRQKGSYSNCYHLSLRRGRGMARGKAYRIELQQNEHLNRLRDGWNEVQAEEARQLRRLTVKESLQDLLSLQNVFEPQLQRTESLFRADRLAHLQNLQDKLSRLAVWMRNRRGSPV